MHKNTLLLFLFLCTLLAFSQNDDAIKVEIKFIFKDKPIVLGKNYISTKKDTLRFETIKFYLSSFEMVSNENTTHKEQNSYHLIDIDEPESLQFEIKSNSINEIKSLKFNIGVDSLASVSGAMDGDLDATKGMYWSWQSGFINTKIEGISNSCKTRKNKFQFHVGGYLKPNYAMKSLEIPIEKRVTLSAVEVPKSVVYLIVDLAKLFDEVELAKTNTIMIPGKEAMNIADLSAKMFSIE